MLVPIVIIIIVFATAVGFFYFIVKAIDTKNGDFVDRALKLPNKYSFNLGIFNWFTVKSLKQEVAALHQFKEKISNASNVVTTQVNLANAEKMQKLDIEKREKDTIAVIKETEARHVSAIKAAEMNMDLPTYLRIREKEYDVLLEVKKEMMLSKIRLNEQREMSQIKVEEIKLLDTNKTANELQEALNVIKVALTEAELDSKKLMNVLDLIDKAMVKINTIEKRFDLTDGQKKDYIGDVKNTLKIFRGEILERQTRNLQANNRQNLGRKKTGTPNNAGGKSTNP